MADNPFDRVNFGLREPGVSDDRNRVQAQDARRIAYLVGRMFGGRSTDDSEARVLRDSFYGPDFRVAASSPAAMSVVVGAGLGWHYLASDLASNIGSPDLSGVDDLDPYKPILMMQPYTFTVPTAPVAPNTRIDIVEVRADRYLDDSTTRRQLNQATGAFDPHDFYKTLSVALDGRVAIVNAPADSTEPLSYKVGVAANPGTVPATTAGYIKLAEILVGSGVASIADSKIIDRRKLLAPGGILRASVSYFCDHNGGAPVVSIVGALTPPGVQYAVAKEGATRGVCRVYFAAGEITRASVRAQTWSVTAAGAGDAIIPVMGPILLGLPLIQTVDAGLQAALAAATPAINVGIGTQVVAVQVEGRYAANGGTLNSTNAALEGLYGEVDVALAYT